MIPLGSVLMLAGLLFALSVAGIFLNRKNVILLLDRPAFDLDRRRVRIARRAV